MIDLTPALKHHVPQMLTIENDLFGRTAWNEKTIIEEVTGDYRKYYVLEDEKYNVYGYAGILIIGKDADVQTIAVEEKMQGQGLGKRLLKQLLQDVLDSGAQNVFLEVRADNGPARLMYEKAGFKKIGVREKYYMPDGVDAEIMQLKITDLAEEYR